MLVIQLNNNILLPLVYFNGKKLNLKKYFKTLLLHFLNACN